MKSFCLIDKLYEVQPLARTPRQQGLMICKKHTIRVDFEFKREVISRIFNLVRGHMHGNSLMGKVSNFIRMVRYFMIKFKTHV
jgi:hypothetical protein